MVVEVGLQSPVLCQFVIHVELTDEAWGIARIGIIRCHHTEVGLDGKSILEELGSHGELVFIVRIVITRVVSKPQIEIVGDVNLKSATEDIREVKGRISRIAIILPYARSPPRPFWQDY